MSLRRATAVVLLPLLAAAFFQIGPAAGPVPTTLKDFEMPGSQPGQSGTIEDPDRCDNCHGGYGSQAVEPAFNWRGGMMAQAARDPLYYATLAIANQDAPNSGDLCLRCHTPKGWLEGRSTVVDGSALTAADRQGVQCDFCHRMVQPTPLGVNPYPSDAAYTSGTYPQDQSYLATLAAIPTAAAHGMFVVDALAARRGPFTDATGRHKQFYSPFHAKAAICGTCHDVSNPVFSRQPDGSYAPNAFDAPPPSSNPYDLFPVERTYSEWLASAYNTPQGIYAPQFGGNKTHVSSCQDCHMKDVSGKAAQQNDAVYRNDLPLHDMTGGNTWVPGLIESVFPGESDPVALAAGVQRATDMLKKAATLELAVEPENGAFEATVRVINETGHKLPSGYPEGRRIWVNLKAFNASGQLVYESGAYNAATGVLTHDTDAKIYEIKPGISESLAPVLGKPAGPSFHFVLNNKIFSDNRIPPRGFTNAGFATIQSPAVAYTYADGQYWDDTEYDLPSTTSKVVATLYYQTTSKEYVEFLRDENVTNDWGQVMFDLWNTKGKSAPVAMATKEATITSSASLAVKLFLAGPFASGQMSTALHTAGLVPKTQPYNQAPWNHAGSESFAELPAQTVDWVLLRLLSGNAASPPLTVASSRAAILLSDGSVQIPDAASWLAAITPGSYYVAVYHRNHLGIMSAAKITIGSGAATVDLTSATSVVYGGASALVALGTGKYGLVPGDADGNGQVQNTDKNIHWAPNNGSSGYKGADFDLNGQVQNTDKNLLWAPFSGRGTLIPNLN